MNQNTGKNNQAASTPAFELDINEVIIRLSKYLLEGLVVVVVAFLLPSNQSIPLENIIMLGLVASMTFSLLDLFAPSVGQLTRVGSGFGIGTKLVAVPAKGLMGIPF